MTPTHGAQQALISELPERVQELIHDHWHEACRSLSAQGLQIYLQGTLSLHHLKRGDEVVYAWLECCPLISKEIGDEVLEDLIHCALSLSSKTSGAVVERVLSTSSVAAKRLNDAELFLQYLQFIQQLSATVPRGIRPMLENLETLFEQLTLGGLRRWALWGASAYKTQFDEQLNYFSLQSRESLAVIQQERKGVLLVDVQRRLNMYLRALWGRDFFMRPTAGDLDSREGQQPFIEDYLLHLPDALDDIEGIPALELYRASAAHCAAHIVATLTPLSAEALNPLQMALIGLIEDARVESLAIARFPGLKKLWGAFHVVNEHAHQSAKDYFARLARSLIDESYHDTDPWVKEGKLLFVTQQHRLEDNQLSWDIGVTLAHRWLEKKISFNPRQDAFITPYRDDNRYFWHFEGFDFERACHAGYDAVKQVRKYVNVMAMANEVDVETAGEDAQEIWVLPTQLFPYEDMGVSFNDSIGTPPISDPFYYSEWDYHIQLERPSWSTVFEKHAKSDDPEKINTITATHKRLISRMKYLFDALQPQGVTRLRKLEDGDEIDLNRAMDSMIEIKMNMQPDPRIMMRSVRKVRDIAILVLLDLSESTNETVSGSQQSILDLTREAAALLSDAIDKVGDPFAIHGFCSDGRHEVSYYRFKDFTQDYNDTVKAKLSGMSGQLSTRMGAALRHAGQHMAQVNAQKKLILLITDGEPADVDVRDPQYLRQDTKKAVESLGRQGIQTFCMSLDPRADHYVARIFGQKNYMVVDRVDRLPEKLPLLYASLTR
ncbi:MAG: VWA domain-containing protein [Ferrovum sp. 37-45-19]|uniref:nitric oxide reductase activation protein NorD n=1 Tax=Ferrovum sp. JA12 TaxID=1356299 RepID=UPI0007027C4F|nr:nitric oxide reductase activation protein NorD [Ferrovum sp. JA12]OYV79075.1 MAG: VWA domain-containing protein [Ferrovum sp. 21-44-67]OYV93688.1 MAG: VWA domain-containing protein [Ferrovum sp. 37-45-19]OZB31665.1 MAG: VWA domain-containing protein [Ferrovum sp. 34-44-207]HQT82176.1 nitric oxide reductase activation protein NorD [Ferrovaceae bacterium]KRH78412.1 von Willebrand factor type A domain protein [Ferrovum sp. JA12]